MGKERYIKAEAVKAELMAAHAEGRTTSIEGILRVIDLVPEEDVAPVVRCKNCLNGIREEIFPGGTLRCKFLHLFVGPDSFCDQGREKEAGK